VAGSNLRSLPQRTLNTYWTLGDNGFEPVIGWIHFAYHFKTTTSEKYNLLTARVMVQCGYFMVIF